MRIYKTRLPILRWPKGSATRINLSKNSIVKNARNIPATLDTCQGVGWSAGKETKTTKKATAPDLVIVYEPPALVGFARVATPLH